MSLVQKSGFQWIGANSSCFSQEDEAVRRVLRRLASEEASWACVVIWTIRPRLPLHETGQPVVLIADDLAAVALAAQDLREAGISELWLSDWHTCAQSGLPVETSPGWPADVEAIDYLFFVHDRHDGNLDAARRYLAWETGLIAQCTPDELGVFSPLGPT